MRLSRFAALIVTVSCLLPALSSADGQGVFSVVDGVYEEVFHLNDYGDPVLLEYPPEGRNGEISAQAYSETKLDVATYEGVDGRTYPVLALLDQEYKRVKVEGGKIKTLSTGPMCAGSRDPMGKMLFCLRHEIGQMQKALAWLKNAIADKKTSEADREAYKKVLPGATSFADNVEAVYTGVLKAHGIKPSEITISSFEIKEDPKNKKDPKLENSDPSPFKPHPAPPDAKHPLRGKGGRGYNPLFLSCFDVAGNFRRDRIAPKSREQVYCINEGTNLEIFSPDMQDYFVNLSDSTFIEEYFATLRMEGIARALQAYSRYVGKDFDSSKIKCNAAFFKGMDRYNAQGADKKPDFKLDDPGYAKEVKAAAVEISALRKAAKALDQQVDDNITKCTGEVHCVQAMLETNEPLQAESKLIKGAMLKRLNQYPYLLAGHEGSEITSDLQNLDAVMKAKTDADVMAVLKSAKYDVANDLKKTITKLCNGKTGDWDDLVTMPELTSAVLAQYPEFRRVQSCAAAHYAKKSSAGTILGVAACLIGSIGPQAVVVGPTCAAIFLGKAYLDYKYSKEQLQWKQACLAVGVDNKRAAVCTTEEYMTAAAKYDAAVTDLWLNAAFAGLEVGLAAKAIIGLRNAARVADPKALELATRELKGVKNIDDAEKLAVAVEKNEVKAAKAATTAEQTTKAIEARIVKAREAAKTARAAGNSRLADKLENLAKQAEERLAAAAKGCKL